MRFEPVTMVGRAVELAPLGVAHAADLLTCADGSCFDYLFDRPSSWDEAGFGAYVERAAGAAGRVPLAIIDRVSGSAVGTSSFFDIQEAHGGVEIGHTWIGRAFRGTAVNPESKLLMLAHAFDAQGAQRVQLKCDLRNERSQRAIAALGAVREGVLRRHRVLPDGYVRDTVMFSIIRDEWPGVRERLKARVAGLTARR